MNNINIGFALTGSFCTINEVLLNVKELAEMGHNVVPILSETTASTDTRFIKAEDLKSKLFDLTGKKPICKIEEAEPIGPKRTLDVIVVAPCTGNTLAKIANAITDTSVTMAVKAHLRNNKPVVIALSSNDSLAANAKNLGELLNRKNIYFVPFYQDDCINKQRSLVADNSLLAETIRQALDGQQLQPIIRGKVCAQ